MSFPNMETLLLAGMCIGAAGSIMATAEDCPCAAWAIPCMERHDGHSQHAQDLANQLFKIGVPGAYLVTGTDKDVGKHVCCWRMRGLIIALGICTSGCFPDWCMHHSCEPIGRATATSGLFQVFAICNQAWRRTPGPGRQGLKCC